LKLANVHLVEHTGCEAFNDSLKQSLALVEAERGRLERDLAAFGVIYRDGLESIPREHRVAVSRGQLGLGVIAINL
jgi:hypothetical protein